MLVALALIFLYATVLSKLGFDWWTDGNYSHGLIVPFVIAYIIWSKFDVLQTVKRQPEIWSGFTISLFALLLLLAGTLCAELFVQRMSLFAMLAGIVVFFFGSRILRELAVPFCLLLLSIPIPQIVFNKAAFPLQLLASRAADSVIGLVGISSVRHGNIIEIVPLGGTAVAALEVVEACSGIRSLVTLATLALILGYFTRERRTSIAETWFGFSRDFDFWRTAILMISAVPIALITNAARVAVTAIVTFYFGIQATEGFLHESAGTVVFVAALALLIGLNILLKRFITNPALESGYLHSECKVQGIRLPTTSARIVVVFIMLLAGGVFINWFEHRGEIEVPRRPLAEMPSEMGVWLYKGNDLRFSQETENVLKADDYVMRYYFSPERWINFYVGYYGSQRSGATYHSPQNCLPGTGWEMINPEYVEVKAPSGGSFIANRYIVRRGAHREILIYWYQGRGRSTASEYKDKLYTSLDSLMQRRSDGAIVRLMTPVGNDEAEAQAALLQFASQVSEQLPPFIPN